MIVKKRKVGFLIQDMANLGGTERSASIIMNGLAESNDVYLIEAYSRGKSAFSLNDSIKSFSLFKSRKSLISAYILYVHKLYNLIKFMKLDVLVIVESTHALYGILAAKMAGIRCIVWEHFNFNVDLGKKKRRVARYIAAKYADDIVVLTSRDREIWKEKTDAGDRITVIPNAIPDLNNIQYNKDARTVVAIGRLTFQKGFDHLLLIWDILKKDNPSNDWTLKIVGDGPEAVNLKCNSLKIPDVQFLPSQENVASIYKDAGIVVLTSRYEGLPMVLLEAASVGIPIVAYDCETGPGEIVEDNKTGYLIKPFDINGFASKLLTLMSDNNLREFFSHNAKESALKFSQTPIINQWQKILETPHSVSSFKQDDD